MDKTMTDTTCRSERFVSRHIKWKYLNRPDAATSDAIRRRSAMHAGEPR